MKWYFQITDLSLCYLFFSKVIERLMYNRLLKYINDNNILYKYQFGFQRGRSTHMALIVLIDKISEALENGDCVIGIFLDFSKAFDTVDHVILLQKLYFYGIHDITLSWFENYLSNRKQYVKYNGIVSNTEKINCGVPQGSILGPLLFLLYINDLSTVSEACMSIMFADDTNMFFTGKNLQTMTTVINEELTKVQEWLYCNKLSLNVLKTHYMIFTSRNKCMNDVDIRINNVKVERVYATKFLGVQIDAQLTWKKHIEYTCKKLCKCVGILAKARKKLHKSSLLTLYYSFAFPYFIYCNHVWGNTYQTNLKSLVLVQKKLIRIISCAPFKAHTEPLMFARRILSVTDINLYMSGIFMYQCLYCSIPRVFDDFFQRNNDVHGHNTRQANDLHVPYARLDIRKFYFKVHGANIWNNTPILTRQSPSLDVFKQRLRHHLIESKSIVHPAVNWTVPMNETITYHPTPYDDIEKAYNTFIFLIHFFLSYVCFFLFVCISCSQQCVFQPSRVICIIWISLIWILETNKPIRVSVSCGGHYQYYAYLIKKNGVQMWQSLYDTNDLVAETMCQFWQEFPPEETWCAWLGTSAECWGDCSCTLDLTTKFTGGLCWDPCPCSISPLSGCRDTFWGLGASGWNLLVLSSWMDCTVFGRGDWVPVYSGLVVPAVATRGKWLRCY